MMKEIAFQPGKFQPMVEIAQRDSGVPAPADTNFAGLSEVALATLEVAHAASRGYGSVVSDPTPKSRLAHVIGYVLACRNIVEQLLHVGVHARVTTPLRSANLSLLEPIVRAYNYYGHFELEGKLYVGRALETDLIERLFWLRQHAHADVADGTRSNVTTTAAAYSEIDTDFYHIDSSGEIAFGKRKPLKDYILDLVSYIHGLDSVTVNEKLPLLAFLLDVSTEASLNNFLRTAKTIPGFVPPTRNSDDEPTAAHKAAMKKLFGNEYSSTDDTIPLSRFTGSITNAYNTARRVSLEYGYAMKTIPIPKYEGGSAAQLASYDDDVLSSNVQVSLSDSTAAVAFTTCFGVSRRFKSAPTHDRAELLRELVSLSLLPVR
uniref:Uncharacterized protein n=1 Tax=Colletotrichum gloeosporioides partitivirus 1 TaxID=2603562 RepID=A0A5B9BHA9_9VIRU|nr:hypothetical protein [Colletotrichum gloeosporioides partitivirus 1]